MSKENKLNISSNLKDNLSKKYNHQYLFKKQIVSYSSKLEDNQYFNNIGNFITLFIIYWIIELKYLN